MTDDTKPGFNPGRAMATWLFFAGAISHPLRLLMARPSSVGRRTARNPFGFVFGLGVPGTWAAATDSTGMLAVLALCVLGLLLHLRKNAPHSMDMGTSWLAVLGDKQSRSAEVAVLVLAAVAVLYFDPFVAAYLAAVAVAHRAFAGWLARKEREVDTDLMDAQIEARLRAQRMRDMS